MIDQAPLTRLIQLMDCLKQLSEFPSAVPLASESYSPPANAKTETRVRMIFDYISQRLTDPALGHAELARFVDMNGSAFSRFFKQTTGRCVTDYINDVVDRDSANDPIVVVHNGSGQQISILEFPDNLC